jgi:hypothetical protein
MSDAFDYLRAHAVRALCRARAMPRGRLKHLQTVVGRIYHLLSMEVAYGPNLHYLDDFRAAQKLEKSLDDGVSVKEPVDVRRHGRRSVASREVGHVSVSREQGAKGDALSGRR